MCVSVLLLCVCHWGCGLAHTHHETDKHNNPTPFCLHPQRPTGPDQRATPLPRGAAHEYRYMTEFQSHEPEFDYLKSLEIEEKIDKVRWCRSSNNARMLLSTNDKTVKLWKVGVWLCGCAERERQL